MRSPDTFLLVEHFVIQCFEPFKLITKAMWLIMQLISMNSARSFR